MSCSHTKIRTNEQTNKLYRITSLADDDDDDDDDDDYDDVVQGHIGLTISM